MTARVSGRRLVSVLECIVFYLALLLLIVYVVGPFIWMVVTSFTPERNILTAAAGLAVREWTLDNYVRVFTFGNLGTYFRNSLLVASATAVASLLVVTPAAYAVSFLHLRGSVVFRQVVLACQMLPGVLLLIPLYLLMKQYGLLNTHAGLITAYTTFTIPFCFLMATSYLGAIPKELFEAALVDGCTTRKALVRIVLPLAAPGLMVSMVFAFILAWNDFMYVNTFVSSDELRTLTVGVVNMQNSWGVQWGAMAAATTVTTLPVLVVFMVANRYIVEGLVAGSVKG